MTARLALTLASVVLAVAIALGAFGAHALKTRLPLDLQTVWQTAVLYHALHGLALIAVGLLLIVRPQTGAVALAGWLFVAGIVLFSGSLYVLALTGLRALGAITPFGGVAFIAGWIAFAWGAWRAS